MSLQGHQEGWRRGADCFAQLWNHSLIDESPVAAVLAAVRANDLDGRTMPERVCLACVSSMPVDGAALSLMSKELRPESVGASDERWARLEELQITVGEGPVVDALTGGAPVLIADLAADANRWPALVAASRDTRALAIFVFPLQLGVVRLGALSLFRSTRGSLSSTALSDALRVADVIAQLLLGSDGDLTKDFNEQWLDASSWTREVHQATGMLVSQLDVGAEEAFVRLRAFAFANELGLSAAARSIVEGRLRLADEDGLALP